MSCKIKIAIVDGVNKYCGDFVMGKNRHCHYHQLMESKIVLLDDNELSLAMYAQEYPENWKKMCDSLNSTKANLGEKHE